MDLFSEDVRSAASSLLCALEYTCPTPRRVGSPISQIQPARRASAWAYSMDTGHSRSRGWLLAKYIHGANRSRARVGTKTVRRDGPRCPTAPGCAGRR